MSLYLHKLLTYLCDHMVLALGQIHQLLGLRVSRQGTMNGRFPLLPPLIFPLKLEVTNQCQQFSWFFALSCWQSIGGKIKESRDSLETTGTLLDIKKRSAERQDKALRSEVWHGFAYAILVHVIAVPLVLAGLWMGGVQVIYVIPVYRRLVRRGASTHCRKGFVVNCIVLFLLSSACTGWASFAIYQLSGF